MWRPAAVEPLSKCFETRYWHFAELACSDTLTYCGAIIRVRCPVYRRLFNINTADMSGGVAASNENKLLRLTRCGAALSGAVQRACRLVYGDVVERLAYHTCTHIGVQCIGPIKTLQQAAYNKSTSAVLLALQQARTGVSYNLITVRTKPKPQY